MKKFRYIIMLLAVIGFTACDNKSIEDLQGEFNNITFCTFNNGSVQPTTKLGKGIKALNTQFTDAAGNSLSLSFGSKEWILGEGTYQPVATLTTGGTYAGTINGATISEGSIDVSAVNGCYFISGLVKTSDGKQYKPYFKGELTFIVGAVSLILLDAVGLLYKLNHIGEGGLETALHGLRQHHGWHLDALAGLARTSLLRDVTVGHHEDHRLSRTLGNEVVQTCLSPFSFPSPIPV